MMLIHILRSYRCYNTRRKVLSKTVKYSYKHAACLEIYFMCLNFINIIRRRDKLSRRRFGCYCTLIRIFANMASLKTRYIIYSF